MRDGGREVAEERREGTALGEWKEQTFAFSASSGPWRGRGVCWGEHYEKLPQGAKKQANLKVRPGSPSVPARSSGVSTLFVASTRCCLTFESLWVSDRRLRSSWVVLGAHNPEGVFLAAVALRWLPPHPVLSLSFSIFCLICVF